MCKWRRNTRVDMKRSLPRSTALRRSRSPAFTFVELAIAATLVACFSAIGLHSMLAFTEQRKLRSAAVELSGYLQVARSVANAENAPCQIGHGGDGVFAPVPTGEFSGNACSGGTIPPSLNLRALSGSRRLESEVSGFPVTFLPGGTVASNASVFLTSPAVPPTGAGWCVDVRSPLATVRLGWRAASEASCTFTIEQ